MAELHDDAWSRLSTEIMIEAAHAVHLGPALAGGSEAAAFFTERSDRVFQSTDLGSACAAPLWSR